MAVNVDAEDYAGDIEGLFWYVAESTPMNDYLNTHAALETRRAKCGANGAPGPKVRGGRGLGWRLGRHL